MIVAFVPLGFPLLLGFASLVSRISRGKRVMASAHSDALFVERMASGQYFNNCLHVVITDVVLDVLPHFPFTLFFLPEIFDLDWTIPRDRIVAVTPRRGRFSKSVEIEFKDDANQTHRLNLQLRKLDEFLRTLEY